MTREARGHTIMAHVMKYHRRHSTFPPILRAYDPELQPQQVDADPGLERERFSRLPSDISPVVLANKGKRLRNDSKDDSSMARSKPSNRPRVAPEIRKRVPPPPLTTINHEADSEAKKKKAAEGMLSKWEAYQKLDRKEKYALLKEKVQLQHQLISRNDRLLCEKRAVTDSKQDERLYARRRTHLRIMEAQKFHFQRKHKRKSVLKSTKTESERKADDENEGDRDSLARETGSTTRRGGGGGCFDENSLVIQEMTEESDVDMPFGMSEGVPALGNSFYPNNGFDVVPDVESLWNRLKAAHLQRVHPIEMYSQTLKNISSPSVKHTLEIYERPVEHSSYTGRPIPLTEVLREETHLKEQQPEGIKSRLMATFARKNQQKAQLLLSRKEQQNATDKLPMGLDGYGFTDTQDCQNTTKTLLATNHPPPTTSLPPIPRPPPLVKHLTSFSKEHSSDDSNRHSLLSHSNTSPVLMPPLLLSDDDAADAIQKSDSIFITDFEAGEGAATPSHGHLHSQDSSVVMWQPLSLNALTEYTTVKQLQAVHEPHPVTRTKLWKPLSSLQ